MPTLEELEDNAWNQPDWDSSLVRTCHQLRKKPIEEFSIEELRVMIGQNIGAQFLIPAAVVILEADPLAEGGYYPGDLLKTVICMDSSHYKRSRELVDRLIAVATKAIDRLRLSPDDADLIEELQRFISRYASTASE